MINVPIWIWYLVGAVLGLVAIILLGWIALFLKAYPERKRDFERMKAEFEEQKGRVERSLAADRAAMIHGSR
jgi:membrane protein implicated in regulation of membrane protease activity